MVTDPAVDLGDTGTVPPGAYDRVVRIVSWVFILATSTIVAVTGLWRDTQPAIYALLAAAGLFVLVVHDLLPPSSLGSAKFRLRGHSPKTVRIKLNRRGKLLAAGASNKGARVKLRIVARDSKGNGWRTTDALRLKG